MIEVTLVYIIAILGTINAIRMALCFVLGEIYSLLLLKSSVGEKSYTPLVSIIIPAYNEESVILRTLDSVAGSNYAKNEIIVVDDGSRDKTSAIVQAYVEERGAFNNVRLVTQKNGGKARALNNGIKNYAKGALIMSLDADSIIAPDAISKAVNHFRDPKVVALASNVRILSPVNLIGTIQYLEYMIGHRFKRAFSVINNEYIVGGVGSTFRKSILEKVGYYDTDTITEDIDLTLKILRTGNKDNKVIFATDVLCFTEGVLNLRDLLKQRFRWKYGRFQTLYKNKRMFFNVSSMYSWTLTFLQLPFVLYSEFTFLFDPILIGFMVYLLLRYNSVSSVTNIFFFVSFYAFMTIFSDEYLTIPEKIRVSLYIPLAYLFFFVVGIVEYISLLKSILGYKGVIHAERINKCGWEHVARANLTLQ